MSFGAWIALTAGAADPRVSTLLGICPPLSHYDFEPVLYLDPAQLGEPQRRGLGRDTAAIAPTHSGRRSGSATANDASPSAAPIGGDRDGEPGAGADLRSNAVERVGLRAARRRRSRARRRGPSAPSGPWIRSGGEKPSAGMPLSSRSFSADSQAVE